ncbi:hypothetical protein [Candidatus Berkiella aquae]|uniref:Lipase (Class 3) n=1 Tax=Candidatus Berkiella aquae TaxID=295108 RepID=A0A0Q9YYH0_9GAMM|nr:hypothetical protein [Candidatus Berkiella aquae]MCS5711114.1 hypothetical protein [Candidatus Berkiella aquae]
MATDGITLNLEAIARKNAEHPKHILEFASAHYACCMSYYLAEKGFAHPKEILQLNDDGSYSYHVVKQLPMVLGMYGYILLPKDRNDPNIKIVFRGTDFIDENSALINLESEGPSSDSFPKIKDAVMAYVKKAIQDHYGTTASNLKIQVSGHSQGSSTSQLFVNAFLKERAQTNDFDHIDTLTMTNLNDPGVSPEIRMETDDLATCQAEIGKPIELRANFGMVGGDIVQTLAQDMSLVRLPPEICRVTLLKIDKGLEGNWRKNLNLRNGLQWHELFNMLIDAKEGVEGSHSNINFFTLNKADGEISTVEINVLNPYQRYTNKDPQEREILLSELLNKAKVLKLYEVGYTYLGMPAYYGAQAIKFVVNSIPLTAQDYLYHMFGENGYCAYELYEAYKRGDLNCFSPVALFSNAAKRLKDWIKPKIPAPLFKLNELSILQAITRSTPTNTDEPAQSSASVSRRI